MSPCIVGTWKPRIIVPESIVTESSTHSAPPRAGARAGASVRGDLWTNWLLLPRGPSTGSIPWPGGRSGRCRPNAKRPATSWRHGPGRGRSVCVRLHPHRLAASLAPSGMAPAMIGLISSTPPVHGSRRTSPRPLRSRRCGRHRGGPRAGDRPDGLTDAMPGAQGRATNERPGTRRYRQRPTPSADAGVNQADGAGGRDHGAIVSVN